MGATILKATLLLLLLGFTALVLLVGLKEPDEPDRAQNEAASGGGARLVTQDLTMPEKGAFAPGRYSTAEEFKPSLSFELGEGWRVLAAPHPYSLKLGYVTPGRTVAEGKALRFLNVQEVFEPSQEKSDVSFRTEPVPRDLLTWFQRHPHLRADEPEPVVIGEVAGRWFDVEAIVPEGYRDDHGGGCAVPCVPLFLLGGGDSVTHITEEGKDRFIILEDVRGETVIIIISAPAVEFDKFISEAQKVLDTVEWTGV